MIWELGQDSTKEMSLLTAVHYKIKELGANTTISNCDIPAEELYAFGFRDFKKV